MKRHVAGIESIKLLEISVSREPILRNENTVILFGM